ncbi:YmfQ family protein [Pseudomonas sp. 7-41]|uniref:YmfQ family protein n=1 Tax=Pseudomonas sp. 7-41 TaxID=2898483 RepID=UPI001E4D816D|nr:putative phage tail protein [Pseudomonas sp. 7-41]UHG95291.1 YmfQ family protein [Pseudomonas sp. 7-41]
MVGLRDATQYQTQLRTLLPAGPAWDPELVPELEKILLGVSQELARIDVRAFDLINEMDPLGVNELVPEWERVMGLPDPCMGDSPAFEDRRLAVRQRLVAVGGQSRAYFIDIAIRQGYPSAGITERRAPRFGRSRFGAAHFGTWAAQFMWTLNSGPRRRLGRRFGASFWGERFGANPSGALECVIRRSSPGHTLEFIDYGVDD